MGAVTALIFTIALCLTLSANAGTIYVSSSSPSNAKTKSFSIDYNRNTFVKDGVPFTYVGGSLHYWRVPPSYWRDRLQKMASCGLDVVTTYVNWALHEPRPGELKFEGNLDLVRFLRLAQEEGLSVILRPGPYIDAETDLGGLPSWILRGQNLDQPEIFLRTSDPRFLVPVTKWFERLFGILRPLIYSAGGPIIMVQVENEYGAYPACDKAYLKALVDLTRTHLSKDVVLFSTDGNRIEDLECSKVEGVYSTIDFGVDVDQKDAFKIMRMFEPKGPLVNSEFYTGWLDYWGDHHHHVSTSILLRRLEQMQAGRNTSNAVNVNMYMFHGGTSFGYVNGADDTPYGYLSVSTSYDYDSPLNEAGDVTDKYNAICGFLAKQRGKPLPPSPPPPNSLKHGFGSISLEYAGDLFDALDIIAPFGNISGQAPIPMEFTEMPYGFILYSSIVGGDPGVPSIVLSAPGLRDRGYVFLGEERNMTAILSRGYPAPSLETILTYDYRRHYSYKREVHFLVENQGRVAYGPGMNFDLKGILGIVKGYIAPLMEWNTSPLDIGRMALLHMAKGDEMSVDPSQTITDNSEAPRNKTSFRPGMPSFFKGKFVNNLSQKVDTFFLPSSLRKGQLFINGVNMGRYWPAKGPQQTLFIPRDVIKFGLNDVMVFELEPEQETPVIQLVDKPKLDKWG